MGSNSNSCPTSSEGARASSGNAATAGRRTLILSLSVGTSLHPRLRSPRRVLGGGSLAPPSKYPRIANSATSPLASEFGTQLANSEVATSSTVTPNLYKPEEAELLTILSVAYIGLISSPVILVVVCIGLITLSCCCK